jgi:DNA-binding response OmpR family regulator
MRVLVAEDVRRLADDIAEGLRDQGMAVDVAHDGLAAVAKISLTPYDVIVLDRDLPGLHGDTICQIVIASPDPAMVLMLTASGTPEERTAGLALGADDYLPKPFHFPELVLRVQALARRKPTAKPRILRHGTFELDATRRTATRTGVQLDLSRNEYNILEALIRAAPAPLSAEELLTQVWDENADPFTKTVTVTISRLRRKLGHPNIIDTIRGVGYRIMASTTEQEKAGQERHPGRSFKTT